jgi:glycosyltransferase involved in cell wall biosynthesis
MTVMMGVRRACPEARLHLLVLSPGPLVDRATQAGIETTIQPLPDSLAAIGDSQVNRTGSRVRVVLSMLSKALTSGGAALSFLGRLRQTIRIIAPDLIHSNGIKTHCLVSLAAGIGDVPIVWHVHDFFGERPLARRLLRLASRRLSCAIAISKAVASDLKTLGFAAPTAVIPNVVDVNEFFPAPQDGAILDRLAGLDPAASSCLRVGLVATYARWKGQDVFLKAAAQVIQANPALPVRYYIIGGPIYQTRGSQFDLPELQELASRLNLDGFVGFVSFQTEVAPIFRALDVVVHASTAPEPFGLTIIEAMACGKPVVATFAGGVVDLIDHGQDGLGVPPGDFQALGGAVQLLLADADLRRRLGMNARETVRRRFHEDRLGQQILDVYEPLLNRHCTVDA